MKKYTLVIILSVLIAGCSFKPYDIRLEDVQLRAVEKGITVGVYKEYYENGELRSEVVLRDEQLNGLAKAYTKKGTLYAERNYVNGIIEGNYKNYYFSGELHSIGVAKNNKTNGEQKTYYKTGELMEDANMRDGIYHGKTVNYYKSGVRQNEAFYEYGCLKEFSQYKKSGKLKKKYSKEEIGKLFIFMYPNNDYCGN